MNERNAEKNSAQIGSWSYEYGILLAFATHKKRSYAYNVRQLSPGHLWIAMKWSTFIPSYFMLSLGENILLALKWNICAVYHTVRLGWFFLSLFLHSRGIFCCRVDLAACLITHRHTCKICSKNLKRKFMFYIHFVSHSHATLFFFSSYSLHSVFNLFRLHYLVPSMNWFGFQTFHINKIHVCDS